MLCCSSCTSQPSRWALSHGSRSSSPAATPAASSTSSLACCAGTLGSWPTPSCSRPTATRRSASARSDACPPDGGWHERRHVPLPSTLGVAICRDMTILGTAAQSRRTRGAQVGVDVLYDHDSETLRGEGLWVG